jgi:phosphatidylinositol alpha-mannosyltransferase
MKIGFVFDDTLDSQDGVPQYILTLGSWFSGQGHDVHYLVGSTARTDIPGIHSMSRNMKVRFNGNHMSMPLPADRTAIRRLLQHENFDVLHVQVPYSPWMAHRVIMAAPSRTAIIGTFHIAPHSRLVGYATRALAIWTLRSMKRFSQIVSVSSAAADFAQQTYKISTDILPNVVEVARFARALPFEQYVDKPTVMFLGRLVPRKGCQLLLDAINHMKSRNPALNLNVLICGRGPLELELKAFVTSHGLAEIVTFTGFVSEDDKARYLKSADLAVFPSSGGESFGIVLLEAMAAGRPVVLAADNPGYAAVLAPYPAIQFPVGDAISLADKIDTFLHNAAERSQALSWQAAYVPQYDVAVVGEKLLDVYRAGIQKQTSRVDNSVRQ